MMMSCYLSCLARLGTSRAVVDDLMVRGAESFGTLEALDQEDCFLGTVASSASVGVARLIAEVSCHCYCSMPISACYRTI